MKSHRLSHAVNISSACPSTRGQWVGVNNTRRRGEVPDSKISGLDKSEFPGSEWKVVPSGLNKDKLLSGL